MFDRPIDEVAATLRTDVHDGLTDADAAGRLAELGGNLLRPPPPVPAWVRLAAQFQDLVIWILVAAAVADGVSSPPTEDVAYRVDVPGGSLTVTWTAADRALLRGPAVIVARGTTDL